MTVVDLRSFITELEEHIKCEDPSGPIHLHPDMMSKTLRVLKSFLPPETDFPAQTIVDQYHAYLKELPKVVKLSDKRLKHLRARWQEDKARQHLDWWKDYFHRVAKSDFLTGRATRWQADFEWLINSSNMIKVLEGRYDNRDPGVRRSSDDFAGARREQEQRLARLQGNAR